MVWLNTKQDERKRSPWFLLVTIVVVVSLVGVAFHKMDQHSGDSHIVAREFLSGAGEANDVQLLDDFEEVSPEVGMKESAMEDAQILSDAGETNEDENEMDKLNDDQDQPAILVEERLDEHEQVAAADDLSTDDDDADKLDFEEREDKKKSSSSSSEGAYKPRPRRPKRCRHFRRCYRRYCRRRRVCRRACKRVRRCRFVRKCRYGRYGCRRVLQCSRPRVCRRRCRFVAKLCRVECRVLSNCGGKKYRCIISHCIRTFCGRKCVRTGRKVCRRFRRCYVRCRRRGRRYRYRSRGCSRACFRYLRCRPAFKCMRKCFSRRSRCGRRCVAIGKPKPKPCVCAKIYKPVCGKNGKTYSNLCAAKCAKAVVKCQGKCPCKKPTTTTMKACPCPKILKPVCGKNGKTYANECLAKCASAPLACKTRCPCKPPSTTTTRRACVCPRIFAPVCGSDGKTYSNACEARCQNVQLRCQGRCPCKPSTTTTTTTTTTRKSCDCAPLPGIEICGNDGKTYNTPCFAACHGTTMKCGGKCPCKNGGTGLDEQ